MIRFPHLATRLFNVPLMIRPEKAEIVMAALAERVGITKLCRLDGTALDFDNDVLVFDESEEQRRPTARGYDIEAGIAIIPVQGTLVQKLGTLRPYSGMTGYDGIKAAFFNALEDEEVRGICLDIDSPGGEVPGVFDLADMIYRARGGKPLRAILAECAYSAAYALASACDHIAVPRTGGTGSIGVIWLHVDLSKALAEAGITVTMLKYGAAKFEGNEFEPMSRETIERFQRDINEVGELFVATVARNRGLTIDGVRNTEAACFQGAAGVDIGLADDVMSPDEAFLDFVAALD